MFSWNKINQHGNVIKKLHNLISIQLLTRLFSFLNTLVDFNIRKIFNKVAT